MKKRIERLFPAALAAIEQEFPTTNDGVRTIESTFQSYIASFGASVMQMGLRPTLAVFNDKSSGAEQDRGRLLNILTRVLLSEEANFPHQQALTAQQSAKERPADQLFRAVVHTKDQRERQVFRRYLLDAAVATKLCLRTFHLK